MYREGPAIDRSSLIQQASAALMMAKQLIELFAEGSNNIRKIGDTGNVEEISSLIGQADQIYSSEVVAEPREWHALRRLPELAERNHG